MYSVLLADAYRHSVSYLSVTHVGYSSPSPSFITQEAAHRNTHT